MKSASLSRLIAVGLLPLAVTLDAEAQRPPTPPRIGVLEANPGFDDAFHDGLRQLGYVPGKNITIEWRWAHTRAERFPELAAELVRLKVDVIVATNNPAAAAAHKATRTIPIVMVIVTDPVGLGLVASLAHPSGNVTGLTIQAPELSGKRLELLKEAVPQLARVAVLWDPTEPGRRELVKETEAAALRLGLQLRALPVRNDGEIGGAFATMNRERVGGVVVYGSSMLYAHRSTIAELAARNQLPTSCPGPELDGCRVPDVLQRESERHVPTGAVLRRQDPQRSQAGRSARRAANQVRARH